MCQYDIKDFPQSYGDRQGFECSPFDSFQFKMSKVLLESFILFVVKLCMLHITILKNKKCRIISKYYIYIHH